MCHITCFFAFYLSFKGISPITPGPIKHFLPNKRPLVLVPACVSCRSPTFASTFFSNMQSAFKIYYTSTSCGAASFITASLGGLSFESEQVDIRAKKTASGNDFRKINPKGNVPTIAFPDGTILNENVATLTYLADQSPSSGLAPAAGTPARYDYLNKIAFVASELHKSFGPLFAPGDDAAKEKPRARAVMTVQTFTDVMLKDAKYLGGDKPCAADIYAYIVLSWRDFVGVDLSGNAKALEFFERVKAYPGVAEAHAKMAAATQ